MKTIVRTYCILLVTLLASGAACFAQLPLPSHIVILIEENYSYHDIIGSSYAPHINALCADTNAAVFTQAYALEHPSEPNYLDFFSGTNQGCTNDNIPAGQPFTTTNLAAQLIAASKTFVTYSEDLPTVGYNGGTYTSGGANYVRKHNPVTNWMGTGTNQVPTTVNQPFTAFPASANYSTLPTVCYVVPNQDNDMHDGFPPTNITTGDTWLYTHMDTLRQWALANNTLYIITFDEDDNLSGNNIPTIFYGPMVKGGTYTEHIDLYSMLRTIEAIYGLGYAGNAATATTITDCWKTHTNTGVTNIANYDYGFTVFPNPASSFVNFTCNNVLGSDLVVSVTDELGRTVGAYPMNGTQLQVNTGSFAPGFYFYKVVDENGGFAGEGKFIVGRN